jgi:uncharacterized membrane protein YjgN (DUF898 family)
MLYFSNGLLHDPEPGRKNGKDMSWYYKTEHGIVGPLMDEQFLELVRGGVVSATSPVWNERIGQWLPYGEMARVSAVEHLTDDPSARSASPITASPDGSLSASGIPAQGGEPARYPFEFTGTGSEYFRIWVVNLFLSIMTLGIYSAWAKVRRNRFLYRNMRVAGSSFDYHAKPLAILRGRLIAFVLLVGLNYSQYFSFYLYGSILIVFLAVFPWLLTRSFAFRMHNSSWRSIRFRFHGKTKELAKILYGYGLLIPVSLGLCYPLFYHRIRAFLYNNTAFGRTPAKLLAGAGPVYGVFFRTFGMSIVAPFLILSAVFSLSAAADGIPALSALAPVGVVLAYLLLLFVAYPFFQAKMANLVWNNILLGSVRFESTQGVLRLAGIIAANALLTLLTLGLYWPWAVVRLARFRAESMTLVSQGSLDDFAADPTTEVTAAGQEITDAFDVDISF